MNYKYINSNNFADYSSGRVIYHKAGMPNFPVRLAGEIFCRCLEYTNKNEISLYDPCCGNSYILTVLGLLNMQQLKAIIASDISDEAIKLSKMNLSLLSERGLMDRKVQIEQMIQKYQKPAHLEALESINRFLDRARIMNSNIEVRAFTVDILAMNALLGQDFVADIVITDVPYGNLAAWSDSNVDAVSLMLKNLLPVLSKDSVVAIITDKSQKTTHEKYRRVEKFNVGKRRVSILQLK